MISMKTILVDTSVWIDFFKGVDSPGSMYLKSNLDISLIATCPTVIQEVLQGASNDAQFKKLKNFFLNLLHLPANSGVDIAIQAAVLYRELRKAGVTIRKPNDCLIACYAINHDIQLLHNDRDFGMISKYINLKAVPLPNNIFEDDAEPYGIKSL